MEADGVVFARDSLRPRDGDLLSDRGWSRARLADGDVIVAEAVEAGALAWVKHDGGEGLFDDGGPRDALPDADARSVVKRRRDEAAAEECLSAPLQRRTRGGAADGGQLRLLGDPDQGQAKTAQNRPLVARGIGVELLVQRVEAFDRVGERARLEPTVGGRDRHGHVERLARVAQIQEAAHFDSDVRAAAFAEHGAPGRFHIGEERVDAIEVRVPHRHDVGAHLVDQMIRQL